MTDRYFNEVVSAACPTYLRRDHPLFERKAVTDLWAALTSVARTSLKWTPVENKNDPMWFGRDAPLMQVYGPPSSGKSSATYAWARKTWLSSGYRVKWVRVDDAGRGGECWSLDATHSINSQDSTLVTSGLDAADQFIDADIVVFDGLRKTSLLPWETTFKNLARSGKAVTLVSSEGVRLHSGDNDILEVNHRFPSWTMEEYQSACANDDLWRGVAKEAFGLDHIDDNVQARALALEEKFPYGGHSARFMFHASRDGVIEKIVASSAALPNLDILKGAVRNPRNEGAVNTLMAWLHNNGATPNYTAPELDASVPAATAKGDFSVNQHQRIAEDQNTNCLVSKYAARQVIEGFSTDVNHLRAAATSTKSQALEGYALEVDFQKTLHTAASMGVSFAVYHESGEPENWLVSRYTRNNDVFEALRQSAPTGLWIWVGGSQSGYDAVHVYDDGRIRFVQLTAGQTHDFKFWAIDGLLRKLALENVTFTHVDFVVVRPQDDERTFTYGAVLGRLGQGWTDFSGSDWRAGNPDSHVRVVKIAWSS